jgi:hypothetical protein
MAFTKDRIDRHLRPKIETRPAGRAESRFKPQKNLAAEWPEVFKVRITNRLPNGKWDNGPSETEAIIFCDPRPDLGGEDEKYWWFWLLANAWEANKDLAITLHGFRCQGTRLEINPNGGMKLVPEVGENGWDSLDDYKAARDKYLVPHQKQLVKLLRSLSH